jgi:hypothetical protein
VKWTRSSSVGGVVAPAAEAFSAHHLYRTLFGEPGWVLLISALSLVCDRANCRRHKTRRANAPLDIDGILGWKFSCPQDLKRLAIHSRVSISRERAHSVGGLSQYTRYRSRMLIELSDKPAQALCTLEEWLIGMAIVPNPDQGAGCLRFQVVR